MLKAVYESVDHEWRVERDGTFSGRYHYILTNRGKSPLDGLPEDNVLWHSMPKKVAFALKINNPPGAPIRRIEAYEHHTEAFILHLFSRMQAHRIKWSHVISPPLEPGGQLAYTVTIETPGTELAAFSEVGTYAGIPVNLPTKLARLRYIAPPGFDFVILEAPIVIDNNGKRYPEIEARVPLPELSKNRSSLDWQITELRTGVRYWFKYRLVRETRQ